MTDIGRPGSLSQRLAASIRILVIEDEGDIAEFLRAYFRASGYDLVHHDPDSPEDVIAAVEHHRPDVVLLDYGLRGFSGHDAYRLLRQDEAFAFLPVIVVTADTTAREKSEETATGIDGFVFKPFNVNTLAGLVAERIETARALATTGRDDTLGIMSWDYLRARMTDEVVAPPPGHPVAFALMQLRSTARIRNAAGDEGVAYVVRQVIELAKKRLPTHAVLGRTESDELAVIVSGMDAQDAVVVLDSVLGDVPARIDLPGGADVPVQLAVGLAAYPAHASSADELYMAADAALGDAVTGKRPLQVAI
ncbi:MAG TPA: response regulator [Acidimicrobiales bacterium]|jgi:PleD family two-component response regulator